MPVKISNCAFPSIMQQRETLIAENFKSIGMALLETGMAWLLPDERVRKWFDVKVSKTPKRAQMQTVA